ncbi:hypothetical protein AB0I35_15580 [Nocardia sp. NPDC050378]|uniref:IclR family transcriptional regulator n=1 Tax=Nocardia sp. NPDC050378 TaxID=3155400 RepID=UPI0033DD4E89
MKPALAATRAMAVLNFMMVQPRLSFSLSELSKALDVSPASMSSVLMALCDAGYLFRHPRHRTYELGPALVAAGHSAAQRHPQIEAARPEMTRLASVVGGECIGSAAVGEDIMILSIEGRPNGRTRQSWIGQRIPLMPPFGQVFLAWSSESTVDKWIARLGRVEPHIRDELRISLEEVRTRGLAVGLHNDPVDEVVGLIHESAEHPSQIHDRLIEAIPGQMSGYTLRSIDLEARYDVANLAVPVFGPDGSVVFAMTVYGLAGITGSDLVDLSGEMLSSSRIVTREIGGRAPSVPAPSATMKVPQLHGGA